MKIGTVMGNVALASCAPGCENAVWTQIRLDDQVLVAADPVGTVPGDLVLVTLGPSAGRYRMDLKCDALILGKIEK